MIVAGFGFRAAASAADLRAALMLTGMDPDALASIREKAAAPALRDLSTDMRITLLSLDLDEISGVPTPTVSPRIQARFGTGSLAEATAIAGARRGAQGAQVRLLSPRLQTANGMATVAIAERIDS